jgi:hypothetical protein
MQFSQAVEIVQKLCYKRYNLMNNSNFDRESKEQRLMHYLHRVFKMNAL